jgi:hypothetical protein
VQVGLRPLSTVCASVRLDMCCSTHCKQKCTFRTDSLAWPAIEVSESRHKSRPAIVDCLNVTAFRVVSGASGTASDKSSRKIETGPNNAIRFR